MFQACCSLPCRWHYGHKVRDLLQLGREGFTPQLQSYLTDCPQLLWMSQVQAKQYSAATASLSKAAAAATAPDARQLWALTKLSAKAAGTRSSSGRQLKATAAVRLRQLQLQALLLPGRQQPMLAEELAAAALKAAGQAGPAGGVDQGAVGLKGPDAAIAAVEVLALEANTSNTSSYRCAGWPPVNSMFDIAACRHPRGDTIKHTFLCLRTLSARSAHFAHVSGDLAEHAQGVLRFIQQTENCTHAALHLALMHMSHCATVPGRGVL